MLWVGWSGLRGRQYGNGNSQESPSWGSAWREEEGVMGDRHIFRKLKGKVLNSCITPAYGLETMAMAGKQQESLQVCENNRMRRIAGVKRTDKRRMEELREEVGVKRSLSMEVGEEPAKVGWTCRKNGRGTIDEVSGCAWSEG